jgi:2-amino-4-hydroxy-6-hydroxymethyldihydropteridine diphosphokinase
MPRAGIALGSNLGDRIGHLRAAMDALRAIATPGEPFLRAPVYQTEPLHCPPDSPDFLNTVVEISHDGGALELLEKTRDIERTMGRSMCAQRNAPRVIDIDLLYHGDSVMETGTLVLPHPRIGERRFVLQPLAEIRPDLVLPGRTTTVRELLQTLGGCETPLARFDENA